MQIVIAGDLVQMKLRNTDSITGKINGKASMPHS